MGKWQINFPDNFQEEFQPFPAHCAIPGWSVSPSPHILYALHCGGNAMWNVQMHQPIALQTEEVSQGWGGVGVGLVYILSSQPLIGGGGWLGCGVEGTSPVSGKGNKGPLCPVGVGSCCHGHGQVHWQEHVEQG